LFNIPKLFLSLGFIRKITEGCLKSLVVFIQR
jgi:hypothetical protein